MLGRFGDSVIGVDHLTGPVADSEGKRARLVRHELVRGKPAIQDLGNDAGTRSLRFFFDETFCNPEKELRRIEQAFQGRVPMQLFIDMVGFEASVFVIEALRVETKKTSPRGRLTRVEIEVELLESALAFGDLMGVAVGLARALLNPMVRR